MFKYLGRLLDWLDNDWPTVCLGKVLLWGNSGGVVVQGGNWGVVGANGTESGGSSFEVLVTGDEVEGGNSEGRFGAEVGGRQSTSGSADTTTLYLLG